MKKVKGYSVYTQNGIEFIPYHSTKPNFVLTNEFNGIKTSTMVSGDYELVSSSVILKNLCRKDFMISEYNNRIKKLQVTIQGNILLEINNVKNLFKRFIN